jgi:pyridoxine 4-dehydrogenase
MSIKSKRRLSSLSFAAVSTAVSILLLSLLLSSSSFCCCVHALNNVFGGGGLPKQRQQQQKQVGRVSANNMDISAMGIGTWSWGNRFLFDYNPDQDEELYQTYKVLRRGGITLFDTADSYGTFDLNGRAEILLGKFERRYQQDIGRVNDDDDGTTEPSTKNNPPWWDLVGTVTSQSNPSDYQPQQVATKLAPYPWRVTPNQVVQAAKSSSLRLHPSKISIAQLHWSTANYQPFQERALWEGICDVYNQGLCDAIGVSNYGPNQINKICSYIEQEQDNQVPLSVAQVQYSLMTYGQELTQDMNGVCDTVNCRLISYSPLCLGLLTGKYSLDNLPKSKARQQLFRELLPGAQNLLNTLEVIARDYDKTQSQVAINWCIRKGTVPIPGARTVQQAKENLDAAVGWSLRPDAVETLDIAAKQVSKPMIQNIFQTK